MQQRAKVKSKKPGKRNLTRERILDAAQRLFSIHGYRGATTRDIAVEAEVAEVTLFRHFASKEQLLKAVVEQNTFIADISCLISAIEGRPYIEGLQLLADCLLDKYRENREWTRIMHLEVNRKEGKVSQVYNLFLDELFMLIGAYLADMQKGGTLRDFDPELAARAFHGMFFCYFTVEEQLQRKRYRNTDRKKILSEFVEIFYYGTIKDADLAG